MRIIFSSFFKDMTYDYYLKQRTLMCEIRLNQILAKNLRLIYRLHRYSNNLIIKKYTHQEKRFINERN